MLENNQEIFNVQIKAIVEDDGDTFLIGEVTSLLRRNFKYNQKDLIVFNYEDIYYILST